MRNWQVYAAFLVVLGGWQGFSHARSVQSTKKIAISEIPELQGKILKDIEEDYPDSVAINGFGYVLSEDCLGGRLFAFNYMDLEAKDSKGKLEPIAGLYTGSGGTQLDIYLLKDKKLMNQLFSEVLIDWEFPFVEKGCPSLEVVVADFDSNGRKEVQKLLREQKGRYQISNVSKPSTLSKVKKKKKPSTISK